MDSVLRAAATFFFMLLVFRVSGKRSLAEITTFDAVLLLIISEAAQQTLSDGDQSMTNSVLVVLTLVGLNMLMDSVSTRWPAADKIFNGAPLILIDDGKVHQDRLRRMRITEDDVLEAARKMFGVERMEQIKYAVLERSGGITVIPRQVSWANPSTYQEGRKPEAGGG